MKYMIETRGLTKTYGEETVIDGLDLKIHTGEIFALLGLNGAGKTTTIKMLMGLTHPSSGQIRYMGSEIDKDVFKRIGSVLERPGFYKNMTVYKNLQLIQNIVGSHQADNIDEVLKSLKMDAFKYEKVKNLTDAQIQKLALCRALLNSPEILILDEPMNGLDPKSVNEIRRLLIRLSKEKNMTILISSHVLSEVERMADRIGILKEGKLAEIVGRGDFYQRASDRYLIKVKDKAGVTLFLRSQGYYCMESRSGDLLVRIREDQVKDLLSLLVKQDFAIQEAYFKSLDLEDIFLELVK
ncbi:ABC transporter ATP-binding protein [Acidaminobacter sp. JC074]|uniref:ABC transporter ATP-binding protein n=1 Tax=Acidaminobacter sp. JC074 TaxID=2530199 RepID=UPI001F0FAD9A|nr:ABC transporter ATP-binding protein [Acidaminobacter sp. JC074]MCH4886780.1 ABC transporter ATP-binding protein [Acidaminobacter sp. JC074]